MKKLDVYAQILGDLLPGAAPVEEVLWLMVVLHTHAIELRPEIRLDDVPAGGPSRGALLSP